MVIVPTLTSAPTAPPTTILLPTETAVLTPTAAPCIETGQIISATIPSNLIPPSAHYRLYLPPCYGQTDRLYPALYLFHGNISGDEQWDGIGIDETADQLIAAGEIPPLLIIMPDGRPLSDITSGGPHSYEDVIINELLPHIQTDYCVSDNRADRAIGGISRGGYWAFEIAFHHPDLFARVGGHSPAFWDNSDDVTINPLYMALSDEIKQLRIGIDFAEGDLLLGPAQQLHERMVAENMPHDWTLYPDDRHEDAYWAEHTAEYLRWYTQDWTKKMGQCSLFTP